MPQAVWTTAWSTHLRFRNLIESHFAQDSWAELLQQLAVQERGRT